MTEDQLEQEALGWLADVGYSPLYGPERAPDGDRPERRRFHQLPVTGMKVDVQRSGDVLGRFPVAIPSTQIAEVFGQIVTGVQQKIGADHATAQTLAALRDTLLPRLTSGQLSLSDIAHKTETCHAD